MHVLITPTLSAFCAVGVGLTCSVRGAPDKQAHNALALM